MRVEMVAMGKLQGQAPLTVLDQNWRVPPLQGTDSQHEQEAGQESHG